MGKGIRGMYEEVITYDDMDVAESRGISRKALYERVHRLGWSKERAMNTPTIRPLTTWEIYKERALENDVTYNMFHDRIRKKGMTPDEAVRAGRQRKKYGVG